VRCGRPKKKRRPPTPQTCAPSPHGCAPPAGVRAPSSQACVPLPRRRARPMRAGVRAPRRRARLLRRACPPPGRRARPSQPYAPPTWKACAPYAQAYAPLVAVRALPRGRVRPPLAVRAPLLVVVHAPPHRRRARPNPQTCAPPSSLACAPYPAGVRALPRWRVRPSQTCAPCPQLCAPCPPNARALIAGGRRRYIRRGPSHPHFTSLGFVSWDSFVGSLHEVVGMVQHFRFLPF
jgi:hypothetical protein